jgi:orotate phosphoribosyltransferase-like protein
MWYYPLMVDSVKNPFVKLEMTLSKRGFFMAKKGQTFNQISEDLKREAVRLYESGVSAREVARQLNIRQTGQVLVWIQRHGSTYLFSIMVSWIRALHHNRR